MSSLILWSDLNEQLITDAQGNIKRSINVDSIKTSLDNILRTSKGERVMRPTFASDLNSMTFELLNDNLAQLFSDSIKEAVETWENRVKVLNIKLTPNVDKNYVKVVMEFSLLGYVSPLTYEGNFNVGS